MIEEDEDEITGVVFFTSLFSRSLSGDSSLKDSEKKDCVFFLIGPCLSVDCCCCVMRGFRIEKPVGDKGGITTGSPFMLVYVGLGSVFPLRNSTEWAASL